MVNKNIQNPILDSCHICFKYNHPLPSWSIIFDMWLFRLVVFQGGLPLVTNSKLGDFFFVFSQVEKDGNKIKWKEI